MGGSSFLQVGGSCLESVDVPSLAGLNIIC